MFKRTVTIFNLVVAVSAYVPAYAGDAAPDMRPDTIESAFVEGKAAFERRSTIVPFCLGSCPQPETYWAMVVVSDGVKYELNQPFHRGSDRAPEALEISGKIIRPGTRVAVKGTIETVTSDYALILTIDDLDVVMDISRAIPVLPSNVWSPDQESWVCSTSTAPNVQTWLSVWYGINESGNEGYHMELSVYDRSEQSTVLAARIGDVNTFQARSDLFYQGSTEGVSAKLMLKDPRSHVISVPATLWLKVERTVAGAAVVYETKIDLSCSRARLFD